MTAPNATAEARGSGSTPPGGLVFPSLAWFEALADRMRADRPLHEKLGYVDCTVRFVVSDGGGGGEPWAAQIRFEEFEPVEVVEVGPGTAAPDFALEADLATWREMLSSIAAGGGRPALELTLNDLNLRGGRLRVSAEDPLGRDMFFRYNQSLQAFVNASAAIATRFPEPD